LKKYIFGRKNLEISTYPTKHFRILFLIILTSICVNVAWAQVFNKEEKIINLLQNHRFKSLSQQFDSELKKAISPKQIEKIWLGIEKQFGSFKSYEKSRIVRKEGLEQTQTLIFFDKGSLDLLTSFNSKGLLTGIFLKPAGYQLPSYGRNLVYNLENITIKSEQFRLPGEIMYPLDLSKKVPLVIFVHGSGANDRYEGIGSVKVFKDFSLGLLSKGIACMVYDKRTLTYKNVYDTAQYTIWEETVEDAVNAFLLAKTKTNIDTNQIYILGHSQGGYALPLILKACNGVKGGISLAGCSRPLDEVLEDQYHYLIKLDGKTSKPEKKFLKKEMKKIKFVRSPELCKSKPKTNLLVYWPTSFWCDIKKYDALAAMKSLDMQVLFLQGERDYQVTDKDFSYWKSGYLEKKKWSFIAYPKLNHLFIEGEGVPNPSEYSKGGTIPMYVIKDISDWIIKE